MSSYIICLAWESVASTICLPFTNYPQHNRLRKTYQQYCFLLFNIIYKDTSVFKSNTQILERFIHQVVQQLLFGRRRQGLVAAFRIYFFVMEGPCFDEEHKSSYFFANVALKGVNIVLCVI